MTPQQFKRLLDKYSAGNCTPDELQTIDEWFNNIDNQEDPSASEPVGNKIWSSVRPATPMRPATFYLRVAASILLLVAASFLITELLTEKQSVPTATHETSPGLVIDDGKVVFTNHGNVTRQLILGDSTVVSVKPGSSFTFSNNETDKRIASLSGEAFFQVKRDTLRPFYVYSNEIITRVLGTSFNVKAYDEEKEIIVAVKTGKVSVYTNPQKLKNTSGMKNVLLTPNQQVIYNRELEVVSKKIIEEPAILSQNRDFFYMSFDGKPVTEIFEALEKNYGIDIQYDAEALKGCILTTTMAEEGFNERIDIICKAINAEYTAEDAVIVINSKGCK